MARYTNGADTQRKFLRRTFSIAQCPRASDDVVWGGPNQETWPFSEPAPEGVVKDGESNTSFSSFSSFCAWSNLIFSAAVMLCSRGFSSWRYRFWWNCEWSTPSPRWELGLPRNVVDNTHCSNYAISIINCNGSNVCEGLDLLCALLFKTLASLINALTANALIYLFILRIRHIQLKLLCSLQNYCGSELRCVSRRDWQQLTDLIAFQPVSRDAKWT